MNALTWAKSYKLKNENNQKQMEEAVELLMKGKLAMMDDYKQEAVAKIFCEGIVYLESNLLHQRGIHPSNLDHVAISMNPQEYQKKYQEVEKTIEVSIRRQSRLMTRVLY